MTVRLPVDGRRPTAATERAHESSTVLVVDDEASIADGLRLTLEAEGYSVRIAGSRRAPRSPRSRRPTPTWRSST